MYFNSAELYPLSVGVFSYSSFDALRSLHLTNSQRVLTTNLNIVDFLDVTFNLLNETYIPYKNLNSTLHSRLICPHTTHPESTNNYSNQSKYHLVHCDIEH